MVKYSLTIGRIGNGRIGNDRMNRKTNNKQERKQKSQAVNPICNWKRLFWKFRKILVKHLAVQFICSETACVQFNLECPRSRTKMKDQFPRIFQFFFLNLNSEVHSESSQTEKMEFFRKVAYGFSHYFWSTLHLRWLIGFWIRLWVWLIF